MRILLYHTWHLAKLGKTMEMPFVTDRKRALSRWKSRDANNWRYTVITHVWFRTNHGAISGFPQKRKEVHNVSFRPVRKKGAAYEMGISEWRWLFVLLLHLKRRGKSAPGGAKVTPWKQGWRVLIRNKILITAALFQKLLSPWIVELEKTRELEISYWL